MSLTKYLEFTCPKCQKLDSAEFYTSINTNEPNAIDLILEDKINKINCKKCNHKIIVMKSFLFNNIVNEYALYYNPIDLEAIDKSNENLKKILGHDHYLLHPTKFNNWKEFQNEIIKREKQLLNKV